MGLVTSDLHDYEPFGFKDGISQPQTDWERERKLDDRDQLEYGNRLALGEFLLRDPNEYGYYTSESVPGHTSPMSVMVFARSKVEAGLLLTRPADY